MRPSSLHHHHSNNNASLNTHHNNTLLVIDHNNINHNHNRISDANGAIDYDEGEVYEGGLEEEEDETWHALDLSNMGLRHLSPTITLYPHLTALYISHNNLSDLPTVLFTHLPSLVYLDLSYNLFTHLPVQIGEFEWLEELILYNNKIVNLPWSIGRLSRLKNLVLGENPLLWPPMQVVQKGTTSIVNYLRDRMPPPPPPPERKMVPCTDPTSLTRPPPSNSTRKVSVFCYNVLAEKYATQERHNYTPCWALEWQYRKERLLNEILSNSPDILCLQEVEAKHYRDFFQVELTRAGYSGVFRPKSRARTMDDWDQVDGCAMFYKTKQFELVEEHLIEFQQIAMSKHKEFEGDNEAFVRIMTKDNIAVAIVLRMRDSNEPLIVSNTHIHWDPEFSDVKLVQVQFMMEKLSALAGPGTPYEKAPVIICGDFNSVPGSGPYELLTTGQTSSTHVDLLEDHNYGIYSKTGFKHPFKLESAYGFMNEPPFTNYTLDFVGVVDYIFFSSKTLRATQVMSPVEVATVKSTRLPNPFYSSDHVSLMAELLIL